MIPMIDPTVLIDFSKSKELHQKSVQFDNTVEQSLIRSGISTCAGTLETMKIVQEESKTIHLIDPSKMNPQGIDQNLLPTTSLSNTLVETVDRNDGKSQVRTVIDVDLVEAEQTQNFIEIMKDDVLNKSVINEAEKVVDLTIEEKELTDIIDGGKGKELSPVTMKDPLNPPDPANWLTPTTSKKLLKESESMMKTENVSIVQMIDEETRMSAESGSRSQTPAKNISQTGILKILFINC